MADDRLPLAELMAKTGDGDFLRSVAESVLQIIMEADVDGLIGAGRHERSGERCTWRNGYMTFSGTVSNALRAIIAQIGAKAVIPSNRTRKIAIPLDALAYKQRNRIERCFNRLKHFRRFATRYDRRTLHFTGFAFLAATMIWLR